MYLSSYTGQLRGKLYTCIVNEGDKTMDYNDVIRNKNRILAITLLICIVLRCIVNTFFTGIVQVIPMGIGGLIFTALLLLLNKKVHPVVMMYAMVVLMSAISIILMIAFPCTTNYLMFFLSIFFVVIYEDIRPIIMQSAISAAAMVYFYFRYTQELRDSWSTDAMAMCVVYIASGMLVYISLCRLTKEQFHQLRKTHKASEKERKKAEQLLAEIGKSVGVLDTTSGKLNDNITMTGTISDQIAEATEDIARRTVAEVGDIEQIKGMVQNGVSQIKDIADSSTRMAGASNETNTQVQTGGQLVGDLSSQMQDLNKRMETVASSIQSLSEENAKIIEILATLDQITSQTNLLSLNASIEAARAGEHGKGFAVVATEIRQLSDDSAKFTEQIHGILNGVEEQTAQVQKEILTGQKSVETCTQNANDVNYSFQEIAENTSQVLHRANVIEKQAQELESLMNTTLENVNNINDNIESTSAAMEEISASINNLHSNIGNVVDGYHDINEITEALVQASEPEAEEEDDDLPKKKLKKVKIDLS